ncbi:hypothetical protein D7Y44_08480 [Stenotrophomonas maltophilia]|uniref:hypothetical protein n=1 Tax=Stenotrophomonas maltophilia TaxID=40324 RepID=UPI0013DC82F5|nr:hypothetical protein [Stenotrophomonas maltophilia]MBA0283165.1 hypothetical protein [Stenotrophomonas maltophilia]MBA0344539.1 hypothetical protein [Stenotrophomonas maltophilia]MBA0357475.1 hypothetical protein [Stenotrophomonas maltophilia]MBA0519605.1 hypothetical protein [Stenotrophomonas maltophilia]
MKKMMFLAALLLPMVAQAYSGHGGMKAKRISSEVYAYHFDNGFTGEDAMGWDPDLQFAWSRLAAARACKVSVDEGAALEYLAKKFDQDPVMQEIVGVGFHEAQIRSNSSFCTQARIDSTNELVEELKANDLKSRFR